MSRSAFILSSVLLATLSAAGPARAVDAARVSYPNAGFACQGALPAFAGTIRTRPLAIMNEGTSSVFVTCSLEGGVGGARRHTEVGVFIINTSGSTQSVTCTLVDGYQGSAGSTTSTSLSKTVSISAGGSSYPIWRPGELSGAPANISNPNFSCVLPQGVGITYLLARYLEDVGN